MLLGDHQLARHEVVVGDGVGGEVGQVAQAERAQAVGGGQVVDLLAHVPVVTVAAERGVVFRDGGVGRDVAVQEIERVGAQQVGHGGRELGEAGEDRFAQIDVRARRPGVGRGGQREYHQPHAREREREARQTS